MGQLNGFMEHTWYSNNVVPFKRDQTSRSKRQTNLTTLLQGGTVALEYQAQFDLFSGDVHGVEALLRVTNAQGKMLNPETIVGRAEQQDLIATLGHLVMQKACADYSAMRSMGCNPGQLAINVSPVELRQANYAELVIGTIEAAGLQFDDIELEITEGWPLNDPSLILEHLTTLSNLGVSIALDDFGAAHANWVNVLRVPIRTLKIDRALISGLGRCERTESAVKSICAACADIGFDIVAEGVCNLEQRRLLLDMNCTRAQGFGLARPMPAGRVMDIMPLSYDCLPSLSAPEQNS